MNKPDWCVCALFQERMEAPNDCSCVAGGHNCIACVEELPYTSTLLVRAVKRSYTQRLKRAQSREYMRIQLRAWGNSF